MVRERVGRLPVVEAADPGNVIGILTRSDLLRAHGTRLDEVTTRDEPIVRWRRRTQAG
jgi:signal-transduction protein with cAMP-binding, CBS, and nucleotidyltransferase domain